MVESSNSQKEVFVRSEGDSWFERNAERRMSFRFDDHLKFFTKHLSDGAKVLEIGCSDGANLAIFSKDRPLQCWGIDPSARAIANGVKMYPTLQLARGTADCLEFPNQFFDFVFFGFCLYLVDRQLLSKVVSEADRVLKNGGLLGILDFDPPYLAKRSYRDLPGIYSYKADYSRMFLGFPHFQMLGKMSVNHYTPQFIEDPSERVASVVLIKDQDRVYLDEK